MAGEDGIRPAGGGLGTIETWLGGRAQYVDGARRARRGRPHRHGDRDRLRQRRHHRHRAGGAGAAGRDAALDRHRAGRREHQRRLRVHRPRRCSRRRSSRPAPTWAWPSTATATACWRWTPAGDPVDGDQILALCAVAKRARGELPGDTVVTTTMTNLGFRRAMAAEGIEVRWTDVGDRYVMEEMRGNGFVLGGEQSGHLIDLSHGPSGDGLAAGLHLLRALRERGRRPADRRGHRPAPPAAARQRHASSASRTSRTPPGVWEAVRRARGRARRRRPRRRPFVGDRAPRPGDGRGADRPGLRAVE